MTSAPSLICSNFATAYDNNVDEERKHHLSQVITLFSHIYRQGTTYIQNTTSKLAINTIYNISTRYIHSTIVTYEHECRDDVRRQSPEAARTIPEG
jgi:hypothetical protein